MSVLVLLGTKSHQPVSIKNIVNKLKPIKNVPTCMKNYSNNYITVYPEIKSKLQ